MFPKLDGTFPCNEFNFFGLDQSNNNHWLHQTKNKTELQTLQGLMSRWLEHKDGCNVSLIDKSEAGWFFIPERGVDYN